ncbi:hypothetical protein [Celeribacter sp. SCSIO 80788]|uniref:hypothetical protein n=1 Tax=Celeribacter sp. SCSIO 80788 TaxID=3117013 RepID=UPI003DA2D244
MISPSQHGRHQLPAEIFSLTDVAFAQTGGLRAVDGAGTTGVVSAFAQSSIASNTGNDGDWDTRRYTAIQRGNAIEDYLAGTDYNGWPRVGAQSNGYSPAWDFNQGSTWVSLKTVDTTGSGWQSTMRSHIDELQQWSSPTTLHSTKVLDIRVQPGGAGAAQSLVDYGASNGVQVVIHEF